MSQLKAVIKDVSELETALAPFVDKGREQQSNGGGFDQEWNRENIEEFNTLRDKITSLEPLVHKFRTRAEEQDPEKATLGPKTAEKVLLIAKEFSDMKTEFDEVVVPMMAETRESIAKMQQELIEAQKEEEAQKQRDEEEERRRTLERRSQLEQEDARNIEEAKQRKMEEKRRAEEQAQAELEEERLRYEAKVQAKAALDRPERFLQTEKAEGDGEEEEEDNPMFSVFAWTEYPSGRWQQQPVGFDSMAVTIEDALRLEEEAAVQKEAIENAVQRVREGSSKEKAKKVLETVRIYVQNVLNMPLEDKVRRIRGSNEVFVQGVGCAEGGIPLLVALGFEIEKQRKPLEYFLVMNRVNLDNLSTARKIVEGVYMQMRM